MLVTTLVEDDEDDDDDDEEEVKVSFFSVDGDLGEGSFLLELDEELEELDDLRGWMSSLDDACFVVGFRTATVSCLEPVQPIGKIQ